MVLSASLLVCLSDGLTFRSAGCLAVRLFIGLCIGLCICVPSYWPVYELVCACKYLCLYVSVCACIYVCVFARVYIYVCVFLCVRVCVSQCLFGKKVRTHLACLPVLPYLFVYVSRCDLLVWVVGPPLIGPGNRSPTVIDPKRNLFSSMVFSLSSGVAVPIDLWNRHLSIVPVLCCLSLSVVCVWGTRTEFPRVCLPIRRSTHSKSHGHMPS